MKLHHVYVLLSLKDNKFYIGSTVDLIGRYADGAIYLLGTGVLWAVIILKGSYLFGMGSFVGVYLYAPVDVVRKVKQE